MSYLKHTPEGTPYIPLSIPRLPTPIFLTPFYTTDAPTVQAAVSLPEVNKHLIAAPWPYTLEDAKWWISRQLTGSSNLSLQILRTHSPGPDGKLIGSVSLMPPDSEVLDELLESGKLPEWKKGKEGEYELGYYLHPDFQGKGVVKAGLKTLLDWARGEGVERVKVKVLEENVASRRVVEGMKEWERVEGEEEWIEWPENKGGVKGEKKRILVWRWVGWSSD